MTKNKFNPAEKVIDEDENEELTVNDIQIGVATKRNKGIVTDAVVSLRINYDDDEIEIVFTPEEAIAISQSFAIASYEAGKLMPKKQVEKQGKNYAC